MVVAPCVCRVDGSRLLPPIGPARENEARVASRATPPRSPHRFYAAGGPVHSPTLWGRDFMKRGGGMTITRGVHLLGADDPALLHIDPDHCPKPARL